MKTRIYLLCQNQALALNIVRFCGMTPTDVVVISDPRQALGLTRGVFALFPKRTSRGTTLNTQYFYDHMRQYAHANLSRYPDTVKFVSVLPSQLDDEKDLMRRLVKLRDSIRT